MTTTNIRGLLYTVILFLIISIPVAAQTPVITGIGMADYSTPLRQFNYWSIYGTNLSVGNSRVIVNYRVYRTFPYYEERNETRTFDYTNGGAWWYESTSQVNFFSWFALDIGEEDWVSSGYATIQVCYTGGACSNIVGVNHL